MLNRRHACRYNASLSQVRDTVLRNVPSNDTWPFATSMVLFFAVRALCAATAWLLAPGPSAAAWVFAASLLQFLILPFSLHVAFLHLLVLALPLFGPHYVATAALQAVVPLWASVHIEIGPRFVAAFLAADQLLCVLLCFVTPKGRAEHKDTRTLLVHALYGFFNCKT